MKYVLIITIVSCLALDTVGCGGLVEWQDSRDQTTGASSSGSSASSSEVVMCEPDLLDADVVACQDIESSSHAITCAPNAAFPVSDGRNPSKLGWFESGLPGVFCYCNLGECPGVGDCKTDQDCLWSVKLTKCQSGLCVE